MCICMYVCMYVYIYIYAFMHTYIQHTHMHTWLLVYDTYKTLRKNMHTCTWMWSRKDQKKQRKVYGMHTCTHKCMHTYVIGSCVCTRLSATQRAWFMRLWTILWSFYVITYVTPTCDDHVQHGPRILVCVCVCVFACASKLSSILAVAQPGCSCGSARLQLWLSPVAAVAQPGCSSGLALLQLWLIPVAAVAQPGCSCGSARLQTEYLGLNYGQRCKYTNVKWPSDLHSETESSYIGKVCASPVFKMTRKSSFSKQVQ
jgi:hypothetical protein